MPSSLITDFYFSDTAFATPHEQHKHNMYQMLYIVEGSISCEIAGNKIECSAPALVFIGNYEPHMICSTSERYVRYVLTLDPYQADAQIQPKLLQSIFSLHPVGFAHALNISPIADEIDLLIESLYREWRLPESEKLPEGEGLMLSAILYRIRQFSPSHFSAKKFGSAEAIVASVRMELECSFSKKLNLDAIAQKHHVSRYYLAHAFKRVTGYSLREYLMLCRISFACQQLTEDNCPIKKIAETSGFQDMSNFSRYFKKMTGMSPSDFRKKTEGGQVPH